MKSERHSKSTSKRALDREVFIQAGLKLAENSSAGQLTYRDIGRELNIDATAIYRNFRSKEDLLAALLDRLLLQIMQNVDSQILGWETKLLDLAEQTLQMFLRYPLIAIHASTLTTHGPGELACMELMLECFAQAGLRSKDLAAQYAIFASYIISSSVGLVRDKLSESPSTTDAWFSGNLDTDLLKHPHTAQLGPQILNLDHHQLFLAGAQQIIAATNK